MRMNKKGAELAIGTIVIIVLALIVLVVVALGFTSGWKNLWEKINLFGGGSTLASVGQACQIACSAQDQTTFCKQSREVKSLSPDQVGSLQLISTDTADKPVFDREKGTAKNVNCNLLRKANLITSCTDIPEDSCK